MKTWIVIATLLFSVTGLAYIPHSDMIFERLGRNHGWGYFIIDQNVTLPGSPEPIVIKEQWLINVDGSMRLRVRGTKNFEDTLDLTIIYQNGQKYYVTSEGYKKVVKPGRDFVAPLFFTNNKDTFKEFLKSLDIPFANNVNTPTIGDEKPAKDHDSSIKVRLSRNPHVRLARVGGKVAYRFGHPNPDSTAPMLWIEQDQFHVLKVRTSDQTIVTASNYVKHARNFWLPQVRTIESGPLSVSIELKNVRPASSSSTNKENLSHTSLDAKKHPHLKIKLPDEAVIQQFYQRYR